MNDVNSSLLERIKEFLKEKRKKKLCRSITIFISSMVTLVTIYILTYPAIATTIEVDLNNFIKETLSMTSDSSIRVEEGSSNDQVLPREFSETSERNVIDPWMNDGHELTTSSIILPDGTILTKSEWLQNPFRMLRSNGEVPPEPAGTPINLENYIQSWSINNSSGSDIWVKGDNINFKIVYGFDVGTLKIFPKRNTFSYTLDKLKVSEYLQGDIFQPVTTQSGNQGLIKCGIFKIGKDPNEPPSTPWMYQTAENKIFLIFDDDAIRRNQTQIFVRGNLDFKLEIDDIQVGEDGRFQMRIKQDVTANLQLIADLQAEKEGSVLNQEQGKVEYKLKVYSRSGTGGQIRMSDNMFMDKPNPDSKTLRSITNVSVTKKKGTITLEQFTRNIPWNSSDFNIDLPKLKPGESYELTYQAQAQPGLDLQSGAHMFNQATFTANNYPGVTPSPVTTYASKSLYLNKLIDKKSVLVSISVNNQMKDKVKWIIKINEGKTNLDGWRLTDNLGGSPYTGPVSIYRNSESPGNFISENVRLPFDFSWSSVNNTRDTFLVIYYTDPPPIGQSISNTAYLQKNGKTVESSHTFNIINNSAAPIKKWDLDSGDETKTETLYNYYGKKQEGEIYPLSGNNLLQWKIEATIPATYNREHDLIIKDTLPEGTILDKDHVVFYPFPNDQSQKWHFNFNGTNQATLEAAGHILTVIYYPVRRSIEFKVPKFFVHSIYNTYLTGQGNNQYPVRFGVGARIVDPERNLPYIVSPSQFSMNAMPFTNVAKLYFKEGNVEKLSGTTSQTKKIFKSGEKILLHKSHNHSGGAGANLAGNKVRYSLIVNPNGETLLTGSPSDKLVLEDVFSYRTSPTNPVIALLNRDSIKVYEDGGEGSYAGGNTDELLPNTEYTYNFFENQMVENMQISANKKLSFHLPDSKRLRVEYEYDIIGASGVDFFAGNKATLLGYADQGYSAESVLRAKISAGGATISTQGITFKKYGVKWNHLGEKQAHTLQGVEFKIYKYNKASGQYEVLKDRWGDKIFTSGSAGEFKFLEYNIHTAYKLVEYWTPQGYNKMKPLEFFVSDPTVPYSEATDAMPPGFRTKQGVTVFYGGMTKDLENEKNETDIQFVKIWKDIDGNLISNKSGSVTLNLYRKTQVYNENDEKIGFPTQEIKKQITLTEPTWTSKEEHLPIKEPIDGSKNYKGYSYYVKEASTQSGSQYEVEYSHDENTAITAGIITVTNKQKWVAELPKTGGRGKGSYYIAGGCFLLLFVFMLYIHRRRSVRNQS